MNITKNTYVDIENKLVVTNGKRENVGVIKGWDSKRYTI